MIEADAFYIGLGSAIRRVREQRGFTQADLGQQIGLSRTSVTNVEAGRQRLLVDQICRVAAVLRCDLALLVDPAIFEGQLSRPSGAVDLSTLPLAVAQFIESNFKDDEGTA